MKTDTINKELLAYLLGLESSQQDKVLAYIKDLLDAEEMTQRTRASMESIKEGRTRSINEFREQVAEWKKKRTI